VKTLSDKVAMHSLPCKMIGWGVSFYLKFLVKLTALELQLQSSTFGYN